VISKHHAAPSSGMPAHSNTAHHRRCNNDWCRHHDTRGDYDWRDDDNSGRPSIRQTSSTWSAVKAGTASGGGTGAVNAEQ
jgi:hypothetical protein